LVYTFGVKKFLSLLLLFGTVGCVSVLKFETHASHRLEPDNNFFYTTVYEKYEDIKDINGVFAKVEAMSKTTGETYFRTFRIMNLDQPIAWSSYKLSVKMQCETMFSSKCFITRRDRPAIPGEERVFYTSLEDYKNKQAEYKKNVAEAKIKAIKDEEEKKLAIVYALKDRCISYGFTGNNNIAACVQREAKHDYELAQNEYELQLAQQQLMTQQNQTQIAPEVPWYLVVLVSIAEGAAEGYKQKALIQTMDKRYEKKSIYSYCRPGGLNYVGC